MLEAEACPNFVRHLPPQKAELLGFRADEVERRSRRPQVRYRKKTESRIYLPMRDWTERGVLNLR